MNGHPVDLPVASQWYMPSGPVAYSTFAQTTATRPADRLSAEAAAAATPPVENRLYAAGGRVGFQRFQPMYFETTVLSLAPT